MEEHGYGEDAVEEHGYGEDDDIPLVCSDECFAREKARPPELPFMEKISACAALAERVGGWNNMTPEMAGEEVRRISRERGFISAADE